MHDRLSLVRRGSIHLAIADEYRNEAQGEYLGFTYLEDEKEGLVISRKGSTW